MTHTYTVIGMHCDNCQETVSSALKKIPEVQSAIVTLSPPQAMITMKSHITVTKFNEALEKTGYSLSENNEMLHTEDTSAAQSYFPLFLVFAFLVGIVTIATLTSATPNVTAWMGTFMGGFFLTFSFFKLLDLKGFAASYASYDIITKRWFAFGYIYPFIELTFGICYLLFPMNLILNSCVAIVMSISIVGVIESVMNKRKIQCACLGTVFNLPMGTITIIEDALMIGMSIAMIFVHLS
jgi:copper chaperone CopZ